VKKLTMQTDSYWWWWHPGYDNRHRDRSTSTTFLDHLE